MRVDHLRGKVIALIGFVAICLFLFVYLYTQAGGRVRLNQPYKLNALVPDALNIVNNSDVRKDGVKIGRVRDIEPQGQDSKLTFEIEKKDQAPLYNNATVRVRTKTLVGESYLDVDPGDPRTGKLADKATLPLTAAAEVTPLERILSTLDRKTRIEVRRNLDGIGVGLDGHGQDLNKLFGAVNPTVANAGTLARILQPQRTQLAALIGNTGEVLQAFGERTDAFRSLAVDAKTTAEAVVDRDNRLRESLKEIPATLDRAQTSVNKLASFSTTATPVVRSLKLSSRQLSPAIRDLAPVAKNTRVLFKELTPFLAKVDPLLTQLAPATKKLQTVVRPLDAMLRQAGPTLSFFRPYTQEFGSFFSNVGAIIADKDAYGYQGRVLTTIGPDQLTNLTPEAAAIVHQLMTTASLGALKTRANSYPKPGTVGAPQPYDGSYSLPQANGG
ncbi:MAG: hypothetical protein JWM31_3628 [Solirubrobacterales bacterium]|nr:hypothetical protein [Solirubrobacterales bacterium]